MDCKKKVSSRDVAREAGVSQATVSYILNNVKGVSIKPETRDAVMEAVKKLNYHPNEIARSMKLKKSMAIGVVTDRNVTNFYFMKTLEGIRDALVQNNYAVTLFFNKQDGTTDAEFIRYYNSNRLDGIIFAFASLDSEIVNSLNNKEIPFIHVDAELSGMDINSVSTDHLNRVSDVVKYFVSKGVSKIGYAGPKFLCNNDRRIQAFKDALTDCGLKVNEEIIATSVFNDTEIFNSITKILSYKNRPQAILAGSPRFGLFAAKCAQQMNIKVPEELKIIVLGTSNFFDVTYPSLSSVELPLYDMGHKSAELLFKLINGESINKTTVLSSEFVIRDSS